MSNGNQSNPLVSLMMNHRALSVCCWLGRILPDFGIFNNLRVSLLRCCGVKVGRRCEISGNAIIKGWGDVAIGDDVKIRDNVIIQVAGGAVSIGSRVLIGAGSLLEFIADGEKRGLLEIGDDVDIMMHSVLSANGNARVAIGNNCRIAHQVSIKATHHRVDPSGVCIGGEYLYDDITISKGCWICAGAIVIPGVIVGEKNVVAAGAVVTKNTPNGALVAGVPAAVKKYYYD